MFPIAETTRLVAAFSLLASGAAHATNFTYNGFSDTTGLNIVGNAATTTTADGTVLRVVPNAFNQAGAAYSTNSVTLGAGNTFSTQFQFRFTNPAGVDPADGITFVLAASPTGLGTAGFGMGYAGVSNSVAIEFDTYNNGVPGVSLGYFPQELNSSNHVAIDTNGALTNTAATNVYGNGSCGFSTGTPAQSPYNVAGCMANGDLWTVNISYDGSLLNVSLSDPAEPGSFAAITNDAINVGALIGGNTAYVGFTGSNGAGTENEDISYWQFADTATLPTQPSAVPEPASVTLLAGVLASAVLVRREGSVKNLGRYAARRAFKILGGDCSQAAAGTI